MIMKKKKSLLSKTLQKREDCGWFSNVALHVKNQKDETEAYSRYHDAFCIYLLTFSSSVF